MKHILVRGGALPPSAYDDFVSLITPEDAVPVGFFHRVEPGLRLVRDRTNAGSAFAIAHYHTDPVLRIQHPLYFRSLDSNLIIAALDQYEYVFVGVVTRQQVVSDTETIKQAQYIARTSDGNLIDIQTNIPFEKQDVIFITSLLGAFRIKGFPVYCFLLNPDLLHATDGFDFYQASCDTKWYLTTERDGPLYNMMLFPTVDSGSRLIGNTIIASAPTVTLDVLSHPQSILNGEDVSEIFNDTTWSVNTNLSYTASGGVFTITAPQCGEIGYFELQFDCGPFFNMDRNIVRQYEHPSFKYIVAST